MTVFRRGQDAVQITNFIRPIVNRVSMDVCKATSRASQYGLWSTGIPGFGIGPWFHIQISATVGNESNLQSYASHGVFLLNIEGVFDT